jgi:poly(3-hydroxybutyrate) depolymerase
MHLNMLFISLASFLSAGILADARPSGRSPNTGCGLAPPTAPGTFTSATIATADGDREYGVWIPKSYKQNEKTPVIFSYHGAGGTIDTQRALDRLTDTAFNGDHIVVYLQGVSSISKTGRHLLTSLQVDKRR